MAQPKVFKIVKGGRRVPDDYEPRPGEVVRYRFVVDIGDDPKTGKRKQLTRTLDGKREAERELSKILAKVNDGMFATPSKLTVDQFLDEWVRSAVRGKEEATASNYGYALLPVREQLGARLLQKLTTTDVEDLVDHMLTKGRKRGGEVGTGLSPRTIQLTLGRFRSALDSAVPRLIPFNPAAPVKCPSQRKVREKPWSPAEVRQFLGSLSGKRLHAPVMLALMGLRPAETCGLRWTPDVDLVDEAISVQNTRTLVYGAKGEGGRVVEKGTKSVSGERMLPLPAQVTAALKQYRALQASERLLAGVAYEGAGYVVCDELGRPLKTDQLRRMIYKAMAEAGVRGVRPYAARHAVLTFMAVNGVPPAIVSAWAGHADLSLALKVYTHPSTEDLKQGASKLAELLG